MSDWVCKRCAAADIAYQDSALLKIDGRCERCECESIGLFVPLETEDAPDPDAVCAQQEWDDGVYADAVAEAKWEDEQAQETGGDRCPPRE